MKIQLREFGLDLFIIYSVTILSILLWFSVSFLVPGIDRNIVSENKHFQWIIPIANFILVFTLLRVGIPFLRKYVIPNKASIIIHVVAIQFLIVFFQVYIPGNATSIGFSKSNIVNLVIICALYFLLFGFSKFIVLRHIKVTPKPLIGSEQFLEKVFIKLFWITLLFTPITFLSFLFLNRLVVGVLNTELLILLALIAPYTLGILYAFSLFFVKSNRVLLHSKGSRIFIHSALSFFLFLLLFAILGVLMGAVGLGGIENISPT